MTIKKWTFMILIVLAGGILILVIRGGSFDREDYLQRAEYWIQKGKREQAYYSLEKALEKSRKAYGEISGETAEIYRKLAGQERDLSRGGEFFDRAIKIYQLEGLEEQVWETYFEKGCMYLLGKKATSEQAEDAFLKVIENTDIASCENTDNLCLSFYYVSLYQDGLEEKLAFLQKGEQILGQLSAEKEVVISEKIYGGIASVYFEEKNYEKALPYYEKVRGLEGEQAGKITADGNNMSGLCLAYLGETETAAERAKEAIGIFEKLGSGDYYRDLSVSYAILAISYAEQEQAEEETVLSYGKKALSYYEELETITNADITYLKMVKMLLWEMFQRLYPEKEYWEFEDWYNKNLKLKAGVYQFRIN